MNFVRIWLSRDLLAPGVLSAGVNVWTVRPVREPIGSGYGWLSPHRGRPLEDLIATYPVEAVKILCETVPETSIELITLRVSWDRLYAAQS